ncbi:MAG: nitrilase-related carbon-nitrogen hydrolase [Armatimonadota bacterium]
MHVKVAVAQVRAEKGEYERNLEAVGDLFCQLREDGLDVDVLVLPETAMSGYFLEGGVVEVARTAQELFDDLQGEYIDRCGARPSPLDVVVGFYEVSEGKHYNSCLYAELGPEPCIRHVHRKVFLPTYGVFDEERFVSRGARIDAFDTRFGPAAVLICEDAWHSLCGTIAALKGAQIIYVVSASPGRGFRGPEVDSVRWWRNVVTSMAGEHNVFVVYAGLTGFEGGKGLAGGSMVVSPSGEVLAEAPILRECVLHCELNMDDIAVVRAAFPMLQDLETCLADLVAELEVVVSERHRGAGNWQRRLSHGEA